jgi:hypothetical protein
LPKKCGHIIRNHRPCEKLLCIDALRSLTQKTFRELVRGGILGFV